MIVLIEEEGETIVVEETIVEDEMIVVEEMTGVEGMREEEGMTMVEGMEEGVDMEEMVHVMIPAAVMKGGRTDLTKEMSLSEEEAMTWREKKKAVLTDLKLKQKINPVSQSTDSPLK